ncbi:hypothetical protein [Halosolutus gelatinilyticus]|uniref:hypothetical protein n=1 Tax=Halosolutus gelatinilyticus TaxID=2931975 RepID=UPI001FF44102|nr:hypothetical protein [Halosolutus gelatinilyticus]
MEPEVVLICGSKPIQYFNDEFGLSLSTQTGNDAGAFEVKEELTFVTAPNFGYYRQNIGRYSDYADTEEFFRFVGKHLND